MSVSLSTSQTSLADLCGDEDHGEKCDMDCCTSSESESAGVMVAGGMCEEVGKLGGPDHRFCMGEVRRGREWRRFYAHLSAARSNARGAQLTHITMFGEAQGSVRGLGLVLLVLSEPLPICLGPMVILEHDGQLLYNKETSV